MSSGSYSFLSHRFFHLPRTARQETKSFISDPSTLQIVRNHHSSGTDVRYLCNGNSRIDKAMSMRNFCLSHNNKGGTLGLLEEYINFVLCASGEIERVDFTSVLRRAEAHPNTK